MLRNYLIIALRNLRKSPGLSSIKIIGLSIGVCGCIVVFLLARLELSFDRNHTKGENIYRVYASFTGVWEGKNRAVPLPFPNAFRERANGVEAVAHAIIRDYAVTINDGGVSKKFPAPNYSVFIDTNYFKVFLDYKWVIGTPKVLENPSTVVLTESNAKKLFSTNDVASVIGKRVIYQDSLEVTVAGILADSKDNTDLHFDNFVSLSTIQSTWMKGEFDFNEWGNISSDWMCMIRLADGTKVSAIAELVETMASEADQKSSIPGETITTHTHYNLQPLSDIHFNEDLGAMNDSRSGTSMGTIQALVAISVLLLLVAVINFVNLETAQALRRSREVGLRKVMGGTRGSLIAFFVAESFVITFIAVVLALPLAKLSMMFFGEFLPKDLTLNILDPLVWLFVIVLTTVVATLSGLYPAFVLSSYQPAVALKVSHAVDRSGSAFLRKVLTVFQFTFSQALIAGAMIIGLQITWMLNKDLGFKKEATLVISPPWWEKDSKTDLLINEIEKLSVVDMISRNSQAPAATSTNTTTLKYNNGKEDIPQSTHVARGDVNYIEIFGLQLVAGRNIQPVDSLGEILVNEAYAKKIGVAPIDLIGKDVRRGDKTRYHIVGVLKDFNHKSLRHAIEPWYYHHYKNASSITVRFAKGADLPKAVEQLKEVSKPIFGDSEVGMVFLDETIEKFYQSEQRISKLANTATGLAIFISCLGLLGLASFTAIQRTKEIGVRKVLGASVASIVTLLSREFLLLVVISFVIAAPVAWYAGNMWLDTFPNRMELAIWIFVAAGLISVVVALITVGFQAVKAAVVNPVNSLRYE